MLNLNVMIKKTIAKRFIPSILNPQSSILSFALIVIACAIPSTLLAQKSLWDIDKTMKFQLGYVPDNQELNRKKSELLSSPGLNLKSSETPDITNIHLANFLNLGFPIASLPHPEQYNFYLKLYLFPSLFAPAKTTDAIFRRFLLDELEEAALLKSYVSDRKNLLVKLGYVAKTNTVFSKANPYPALLIDPSAPDNQRLFNRHIPFFSLYLKNNGHEPSFKNADAQAAWTTQSVFAFQKELLSLYQQKLTPMNGQDNEHYYYFIDRLNITYPNHITIIKMAKQPLVFNNWRELGMPQDEKHIFLTSLLLTYRTVYTLKNPMIRIQQIPAIDTPAFNQLYKPLHNQVFELASLVYLNSLDPVT